MTAAVVSYPPIFPATVSPIEQSAALPPSIPRSSGALNAQIKPMQSGKDGKIKGRRERPCDACRKRKSRCVINEGTTVCTACGAHGQQCTYLEDPQPRKRKTDSEGKEGEASKRRLQPQSIEVPIKYHD